VDNRIGRGASSPDAPELSQRRANLDDVDEYDPERDGALLKAGEVLKLLNLRSRTSLPEWRDRGDLIGFRMRSGHYRYPANQPALNEARALQRHCRRMTP
jgi:hypothetical protein